MNEVAADAWFFTQDGERLGPVTFQELRTKATEGALNPRLDMVWKTGMDSWKPSGEVEGLFERAGATEAAPPVAEAAKDKDGGDPYAPPGEELIEELRHAKWPGARRRSYLFVTILFPILLNIGFTFGAPMLGEALGPDKMGLAAVGLGLVPLVLGVAYGLMRLSNLGMSRWWFLGHFVPILNLWVGYRCFACPAGFHIHRKLDGVGIALAIFYWLMVLLVVVAVVAMVVLLAGAAGDPEIQRKLQEALQNLRVQAPAPPP